jgi:hypothetical protein
MPRITLDDLKAHYDFDACDQKVTSTLREAMATPEGAIRFLFRYAEWNGFFGSGVASLAGKVGRSRGLFMDPKWAHMPQVADRGVKVGAYVFNAARDEFDDRDTEWLDTHRCLAQAMVVGVTEHFLPKEDEYDMMFEMDNGASRDTRLKVLLNVPVWLQGLCDQVAVGYGNGSRDDLPSIFRALGYHMGSEVLAEHEFTEIDRTLRAEYPELVEYLSKRDVVFDEYPHNAYYWISIHSDLGGGVEGDHFEDAMRAIRYALKYTPEEMRDELRHQAMLGFDEFADDHAEFFSRVNLP